MNLYVISFRSQPNNGDEEWGSEVFVWAATNFEAIQTWRKYMPLDGHLCVESIHLIPLEVPAQSCAMTYSPYNSLEPLTKRIEAN